MRRFVTLVPALVVMGAAIVVLLVTPAAIRSIGYATTDARVSLARATIDDDDLLARLDRAVTAVAQAVEPSVVHIEVRTNSTRSSTTGSGWVFDDDGHLVTNSHVVRGADLVRVEFSDGRVLPASVLGADPFTDIAVLEIDTDRGLVPMNIARGSLPVKGQRVFAFGSPFGFKFSMSEGIVSGLARNPAGSLGLGGYTNFIQTDAAVNPGNSGGPLVDVRGELVGMNVAIATGSESQGTQDSGDSAGISFAIPVGTIEPIVRQIVDFGQVTRGFVGVRFQPGFNSSQTTTGQAARGVLVTEVVEDGPASGAGLETGDLITEIDGYPVTDSNALAALISSTRAGSDINIKVLRDGTQIPMTITLGTMPVSNMLDRIAGQLDRQLGIRVQTVQVDAGHTAAAIFSVETGSIADRAGLRPGQVIERIGQTRITNRLGVYEAVYDQGLLSSGQVLFTVADLDDPDGSRKTVRVRIYP